MDLAAPDSQRLIEDALVCCARSIACCAILARPFFPGLSRPFIRRWDAEETSLRTFTASIRDGEIAWGTALLRILPRKQRFDRCRAAHQQLYDCLRESSPWLLSSRPRSMSALSSPQINEAQVLSSMGNPGNFPVIAARMSRACASEAPGTIYDRLNPFAT